ncbi:MAG TPA: PH domain-containing protein [Burkholderiaceae bacterium]|nr:PH domain-containing protein [Burkholderiaceae bacterium]
MSSYVEKALVEGEKILYIGRISLWSLFPRIFFGVLLTPIVIGLFLLVPAWVKYRATELAVTDKRVIAKFGFVSRHTIELNVAKIESVQVEQSVLGRVFDFGTIIVAGGGNPFEAVPGIADPLAFRRAFLEAQEQSLVRRS